MKICAIAHAIPARLVSNDEIVERVAAANRDVLAPHELRELCEFLSIQLTRTGAVTRYHRADNERAVDLGVRAGKRALESLNLHSGAIDLLIYVGVGRGWLEPATANVFQVELGLHNATCFDVLDACASWLRALDIACRLLASGAYRRIMILNCETNFQEYEPKRIASREQMELLWAGFTVGEAATATIVSTDDAGDSGYHVVFRNTGSHLRDCHIPLPHAAQFGPGDDDTDGLALRFLSRPEALARGAVRQLNRQYWEDEALPTLSYDVIFGHSVSVQVSQLVLRSLKLDPRRHYEIFPRYGNVVSASLPLAMSLAHADGRLRRGHRVLLIMGGAGLTTALATFVF